LRGVFHNAIAVECSSKWLAGDIVQGTEANGSGLLVTLRQVNGGLWNDAVGFREDANARITNSDTGFGTTLPENSIEMHSGHDKINVRGDVRREMILITCDVVGARVVLVNMVFGEKEAFCFFHGGVKLDPAPGGSQTNAILVEATIEQPSANGVDRVAARGEHGGDSSWRPVFPKVGRVRVRYIVEQVLDVVEIRLGQSEPERDDRRAVVPVGLGPTVGKMRRAFLVKGVRREMGAGEGENKE
jgi:hypothetical protein